MDAEPRVILPDLTEKLRAPQRLQLVGGHGSETAAPRAVGRYKLYEEIALGGMGAVHLGVLEGATGFRRPVAMKRLHPLHAGQRAAADALRQEAWLGSRVRHPNVVPVFDFVEADGDLFLVMDFVLGETLARLLKRGTMPVDVAAAIMGDVLLGLHSAHTATGANGRALGIVHRDVSPQNILVGVDGVGRILDFGVAKASWPEADFTEKTQVGFIKGKRGYMAPEQLRSEPHDARADIFAAGVVLWEALTGRRLFQERHPRAALSADGLLPPASAYNRDVTPMLDALLARALSNSPRSRFRTAEEFAEQLQTAIGRAHAGRVGRYVEHAAASAIQKQRSLLCRAQAPEGLRAAQEPAVGLSSLRDATTSPLAIHRHSASGRRNSRWHDKSTRGALGIGILLLAAAAHGLSSRAAHAPERPVLAPSVGSRHRGAGALSGSAMFQASAPVLPHEAAAAMSVPSQVTAPTTRAPDKVAELGRGRAPDKRRPVSARVFCTPPFWLDGNGIKRIKRGCL